MITKKSTPNPLAGNAAVTAAVARIATVAALSTTAAPTAPSTPKATTSTLAGTQAPRKAILLGAGVYTVDGYFALGGNGGGSANCNGSAISVSGANVTLVPSGKAKSNSGSCNGYVFCVAAGYSNIVLTAPQSGATAKLAVIGPTGSSNTGGATFAEGGSNAQISGAFYFPYGPIIMRQIVERAAAHETLLFQFRRDSFEHSPHSFARRSRCHDRRDPWRPSAGRPPASSPPAREPARDSAA